VLESESESDVGELTLLANLQDIPH
jgi:hypothetical protein